MEGLRSWLNPAVSHPWVIRGLIAGLDLLVLVSLLRALLDIRPFGLWSDLETTFRIEYESWRRIGILRILAMAAAMVFTRWA